MEFAYKIDFQDILIEKASGYSTNIPSVQSNRGDLILFDSYSDALLLEFYVYEMKR